MLNPGIYFELSVKYNWAFCKDNKLCRNKRTFFRLIHQSFAKEIVDMALKEQSHRHQIESTVVDSEVLLNSGQLEVVRASVLAFGSFCWTMFYGKKNNDEEISESDGNE